MRRAAAVLLAPFWAAGALVASAWALIRWAGAAAADGFGQASKWDSALLNVIGALLLALIVVGVVWAL